MLFFLGANISWVYWQEYHQPDGKRVSSVCPDSQHACEQVAGGSLLFFSVDDFALGFVTFDVTPCFQIFKTKHLMQYSLANSERNFLAFPVWLEPCRCVLLMLLLIAMGGVPLIENPAGTLVCLHRRFVWLVTTLLRCGIKAGRQFS
jgi:hypothetical protein